MNLKALHFSLSPVIVCAKCSFLPQEGHRSCSAFPLLLCGRPPLLSCKRYESRVISGSTDLRPSGVLGAALLCEIAILTEAEVHHTH